MNEQVDGGNLADESHANAYRWVMPAVSAVAGVLGALLAVVAIWLISREAKPDEILRQFGPLGISVLMFFSSATVLLPAPGLLAVLGAGASNQFDPLVIGIFAGIGSSVGELTGYLVGLGSRKALHLSHQGRWMRRCEYFMRRWGFLTILTMAAVPNPVFDAVGILAGSLGYSPRRLWVACLIGNTVKYTLVALSGGSFSGFFQGLLGHE